MGEGLEVMTMASGTHKNLWWRRGLQMRVGGGTSATHMGTEVASSYWVKMGAGRMHAMWQGGENGWWR